MEKAFERVTGECLKVRVNRVFDGDGFLANVRLPISMRLIGKSEPQISARFGFVDAPEMGQTGGEEARQFLSEIIDGKELLLSILLKSDTNSIFDAYKRLVCIPYLRDTENLAGWRNIEIEMLINGWGWLLERYGPPDHYYDALEKAQSLRRGIWGDPDPMPPWEFKKAKYRRKRNASPQPTFSNICPNEGCGGTLRKKQGRFGPFLGCSNYPNCNFTKSAR